MGQFDSAIELDIVEVDYGVLQVTESVAKDPSNLPIPS